MHRACELALEVVKEEVVQVGNSGTQREQKMVMER